MQFKCYRSASITIYVALHIWPLYFLGSYIATWPINCVLLIPMYKSSTAIVVITVLVATQLLFCRCSTRDS